MSCVPLSLASTGFAVGFSLSQSADKIMTLLAVEKVKWNRRFFACVIQREGDISQSLHTTAERGVLQHKGKSDRRMSHPSRVGSNATTKAKRPSKSEKKVFMHHVMYSEAPENEGTSEKPKIFFDLFFFGRDDAFVRQLSSCFFCR